MDDECLFRPETMSRAPRHTREPKLSLPQLHWWTGFAALVISGLAITYLSIGTYTRTVTVYGKIEPRHGYLVINAPTDGTLTDSPVKEGDFVREGDVLFHVEPRDRSPELESRSRLTADLLATDISRTEMALVRLRSTHEQDLLSSDRQISTNIETAKHISKRLILARARAEEMEATIDSLGAAERKGLVSRVYLQDKRDDFLRLSDEREALAERQTAHAQILDDARARRKRLPHDFQNKEDDLLNELSRLNRLLAGRESSPTSIVSSPATGIVTSTLSSMGSDVSASQHVLIMAPSEGGIHAKARFGSTAAGLIKLGSEVRIRYASFPYQKFGTQVGKVARIPSASTQDVTNLSRSNAVDEQSQFEIDIELPSQSFIAEGVDHPLVAGMDFTADVEVDTRTLIEWILEPLIAYIRKTAPAENKEEISK